MKKDKRIKRIITNIVCFSISFLPLQFGIMILKLAFENNPMSKGEIDRGFLVFLIMAEIVIVGMTIGLAIILAVIAVKSLKKMKEDKADNKLYQRILVAEATIYIVFLIANIVLEEKI